MRARTLLLTAPSLILCASAALAGPHFYGGPVYHVMPESEWTDYWRDEFDVDLTGEPTLGVMAGIVLPGAIDTTRGVPRTYREIGVALYGPRGRAFDGYTGTVAEARYRVYSLEALSHWALPGLRSPITLFIGSGVAWVDDRRQIGALSVEDGSFSATVSAGLRAMSIQRQKQGKWNWFFDGRYRLHRLSYGARGFDLGGVFVGSGFMF